MKTKRFTVSLGLVLALSLLVLAAAPSHAAKPGGSGRGNCSATFADAAGDAVRSDGGGAYIDGGSITVDCGNDVRFVWGNARTVVFNLTSFGGPGPVNVAGSLGVEVDGAGLRDGMAVGESLPAQKVQFTFTVGNTQYRLQYGSLYLTDTDSATVTRTGDLTWEVESTSGQFARLQSCAAKGKCTLATVGIGPAPFKITVVAQQ